ncbi:MAG: hypothetical protein CMJ64_23290 [Planctomycetaceae bacterium]|nr:hypothetical protein [Planctomycetaceae bacterium]
MPSFLTKACFLLIVASCCDSPCLHAAEPDLKAIFPLGCSPGESIEATLIGGGLDKVTALHFSTPGLSAEPIEKNRFRITASDEASLGTCDVWIATPEGLAGPRRFAISSTAIVVEQESNDTSDLAQAVTLPVVVDAKCDKAADLDWFAFAAEKDQEISIACRSHSLDGSVRPFFTLVGPSGRELVHSSASRLEPEATFHVPASGAYRLLVHDRGYKKDDFSYYRIELSVPAEKTNTSTAHRALITSDDVLATEQITEQIASEETPQELDLPSRIAGSFEQRNAVDWFRFAAKKGQTVHIEAFGERLGQMMDIDVAIYDDNQKEVVALKDIAAPKSVPATLPLVSLDPTIDWKVPTDGEYSIAIRDLYGGSVFGPDRVYELIVQKQRPSFYAFVMSTNAKPSRGVAIKRGAEAEASVVVVRTGGFAGEVTVRIEEPNDSVTLENGVVGPKEVTKPLRLAAASDSAVGFHPLRLVAEAEIGSDKRTISIPYAAVIRPGLTRRVEEMLIDISE